MTATMPETVQATAPALAPPTWHKGKRAYAARELTVTEDSKLRGAQRKAGRLVQERYPALKDLEPEARAAHEDFDAMEADYLVEVRYGPLLRACWAGEGAAPTDEEIAASSITETYGCLKACVLANPILRHEFPSIAEEIQAEGSDPNAPRRG